MSKSTKGQIVRAFFESHQAIDLSKFCREAKVARSGIEYVLKDKREPQQRTFDKILPVMIKYGFKN